MQTNQKIVITGGAGFVGCNLLEELTEHGYGNLIVLDKDREMVNQLQSLYPNLYIRHTDLAEPSGWDTFFEGADTVVLLSAQIAAHSAEPYIRNNITATGHILDAIRRFHVPYVIHVSSSVVESVAQDHYTTTKRQQENQVLASGVSCMVVRPTLMFGSFNRQHFGWLARFMKKTPIFPVPGDGRYLRQPLYVKDFCRILRACIESHKTGVLNISGFTPINYIDCIRMIKRLSKTRCLIVRIPVQLFYLLLKTWAVVNRNAVFNTDQLKAIMAGDRFEVIDWEALFGIKATPFETAMERTFACPPLL